MDAISNKAGSEWTAEERQRVRAWVCESEQLDQLYASARAYFPREPAEGVWNEFFGSRKHQGAGEDPAKSRFDLTIEGFDAGKGKAFWSYLRMRFSFFCMERLGVIRRDDDRTKSPDETDKESGEPLVLVVAPNDTFSEVRLRELRQAIIDCWLGLPPDAQAIFALRYFSANITYMSDEELEIEAVARILEITKNAAKVRLFRARLLMKECLKRKDQEP